MTTARNEVCIGWLLGNWMEGNETLVDGWKLGLEESWEEYFLVEG